MIFKLSWKLWWAGAAVLFLMLAAPALPQQAPRGSDVIVYESPT